MQHRDLKRFITGFLVLATITGSLTLVFSSFHDSASSVATPAPTSGEAAAPKIGDKAISEPIPASSGSVTYDISQPYTPTAQPSDNFTDNLAASLAYNLVKANPNGPSAATGITVPADLNVQLDSYVQNVALTPLLYPIDASRIQVKQKYTSDDVSNYLAGISDAMSRTTGAGGLGRLLQNTPEGAPDADSIAASGYLYAKAEQDVYALTVPAPMLDLHKSLLSYIELQKQLVGVDYTNDPVKAIAYAGKFPLLAAKEGQNVGVQVGKVQQNLTKILSEANDHPTIERQIAILLHIQDAQAQGLPTHDNANWLTNILNGIGITGSWSTLTVKSLKDIATQVLKNQIVHRLVQQTIQWIQGGGKPQFVTNWKQFLGDTANEAAGAAIQQINPRLCSGLRPFVVNFLTGSNATGYNRVTCTLDQVVRNIQNFYQDFRSGGWVAFAALSQPQNNLWGVIAISTEEAAQKAIDAQKAAEKEAGVNGVLPTKSCVNYSIKAIAEINVQQEQASNPNFAGVVRCYTVNRPPTPDECDPTNTTGYCGDTATTRMCDVKVCKADGQQITTPGDFVAGQANKAIGADLDNIINAQDLTGLISVAINSAINRLVNIGTKGLLGLFGGNDHPSTNVGTSTPSGNDLPDNPADVDAQRQQVLQLATSYQERLNQASSTLAGWEAQSSATLTLLGQLGTTCANRSAEAQARTTTITGLQAHVDTDRSALAGLLASLAHIRQDIVSATTFAQLSTATDSLANLNNDIGNLAARATIRGGQVTQVSSEAQANITNNACGTPLSPIDDQ